MKESQKILKVALDVPLDRLFDYLNNGQAFTVGQYVKVSFGSRVLTGVICGFANESLLSEDKLKKIMHVEPEVIFDNDLLRLLEFSADYYHHPIGQTILSIVPSRIKQNKYQLRVKEIVYKATNELTIEWIEALPKRQVTLRKVATKLLGEPIRKTALKNIASNAGKAILDLVETGVCFSEEWREETSYKDDIRPSLNKEQQLAINSIKDNNNFVPWLLYGVTGSGKTEVYLHLIEKFLGEEKSQILVLVPEINLTPQLESRFRVRFPDTNLAVLHSNLSDIERLDNWRQAKSGAASIIIGTRLAVFTPLNNLKLIIIDEEHDPSFKQQDGLKYHARDIAMVRARNNDIPIILGTATPSLESWLNASKEISKYQLLRLKTRAALDASLPEIKTTPLNSNKDQPISPLILKALKRRIELKQQSLIFINRRGYAPVLVCSSCGWSGSCHQCSARLVVHLKDQKMRCHHCNYECPIALQCKECGNTDLHPLGSGTQKIEDQIKALIPSAHILRVDRDSMRKKNALHELYEKTHKGDIDILIGTQMLAKGHDFPNLTLVVVLDADNALYSTDFRASERLFSQLMQVSGRSGRGSLAGEVLIQTSFPNHPIFQAVKAHDYELFANTILAERASIDLPPFSFHAVLQAESKQLVLAERFMDDIANWAMTSKETVKIFGPVRPVMERVNGLERIHIYIQSDKRKHLQNMLKVWIDQIRQHPLANRVKWSIDIDPMQ
tara:strand:+ start:6382 stop:8568 length:2187 start_codon:yes stop_codon:yes gene_type:complete